MVTIPIEALMAAARVLVEAEAAVTEADWILSKMKERARVLREETLPHAMLELGVSRLDLDTGETLKLAQEVYAKIPKDGEEQAFAWLVKQKADGIIKTEVSVEFGKGQYKAALKIQALLLKKKLHATCEQGVHPSTLKAFLKESMASGKAIPLELFGAWPVFTTKLTHNKS